MKKFILNALTQTDSPSREETTEWLREKIEKYTNKEGKESLLISVDPCEIQISWKDVLHNITSITIPLWPGIEITKDGRFCYPNEKLIRNGATYSNWSMQVQLYFGEPNLRERIQKALRHLATFCPRKRETF